MRDLSSSVETTRILSSENLMCGAAIAALTLLWSIWHEEAFTRRYEIRQACGNQVHRRKVEMSMRLRERGLRRSRKFTQRAHKIMRLS